MKYTISSPEKEFSKNLFIAAPGVWRMKDIFVNFFFVQREGGEEWVLIDAGIKTSYKKIKAAAAELFGAQSRPAAIILTHAHFDHRGALPDLLNDWQVPVYAHPLEAPYLTGKSSYPPPDPLAGNGGMAWSAWMFPKAPINIGGSLQMLPEDGSVPHLPEWRWYFTPGHAPGHVSFFRESDKVLIAGDAVITTDQNSVTSVALQTREMHGPPVYFTPDWEASAKSVKLLARLMPMVIATGHGRTFYGGDGQARLQEIADYFWKKEVPADGRYVRQPAIMDESGVVSLPPRIVHSKAVVMAVLLVAAAGAAFALNKKKGIVRKV